MIDIPEKSRSPLLPNIADLTEIQNHGKVFKGFVSAYLPDWEDKEKNLRAFVKILVGNGVTGKG
ncbi:MAG: hypothetical protein RM049_05980 [Nostoc sp. DedQUE04]|uniref:hypothetical protein n=1 Tax=Nostoc sp. DedQUE04 TaxID=3075390 RepID=UPI002AD490D8|nr:hypothetical protein [Nostoc sp. DedQUE04]MDZ8134839.1 hypothetical protein [Nostoc sp. DedQUE04]